MAFLMIASVAAVHSQPHLNVSTLLINSGDAVSVMPVGIQPLSNDAIVAYYKPSDPINIAAYDFYRSVAPPFEFNPVNIRSGGITFAYVRDFASSHAASNVNASVLASTRVMFRDDDEQLGVHLALTALHTEMRVTWTSNTSAETVPASVAYGTDPARLDQVIAATSSTFTVADLCHVRTSGTPPQANPFTDEALDIGPIPWHDRGWTHTAVMAGLAPGTRYFYRVAQPALGQASATYNFTTAPAADGGGGDEPTRVVVFGDLGVSVNDSDYETSQLPPSQLNDVPVQTVRAMERLGEAEWASMMLLVGDLSYACGTMLKWDLFLSLMQPLAAAIPLQVAAGNHEMDDPKLAGNVVSGSQDSGGECGVPYAHYFGLRQPYGDARGFYGSWNHGRIHFVSFNTEVNWTSGSAQLRWLEADLAGVNKTVTPFTVFAGHRPYLATNTCRGWKTRTDLMAALENTLEPLFDAYNVQLALWGHVHDYERTCSVRRRRCVAQGGTTHVVIGNAGHGVHTCPEWVFPSPEWEAFRSFEHGYARIEATNATHLHFEAVMNRDGKVHDEVWLSSS